VAIYHLSVKTVSRSAGRSATAAAAYRAGVKITDERTGEIHDYTRKGGVESAELVLPAGAPEWAADRAALWNAAEQAETRKNSTVAREFEIALPEELSPAERQRLARDLAREIVERHGCAADVAIHAPGKEGDNRNHHAHILLSTRRLGPEGFTEKTRELDDQKTGPQIVTQWRERFASLQNERLREAGIEARVDHRTLEAQGIDREPTRHLGPAATGYERRTGEPSRKRMDFEAEVADRLARAKEAGELERQGRQIDRGMLDLSGDLEAAKRERDRQPAPEVKQAAAAGVADFRAMFEAQKLAELGKQQAREAFERQKAEQERQKQAEQARQQAQADRLKELADQRERQRQEREAKKQERDGPGWSR
jgi:ATP-dependent exoDNAse (exonuclease V) alpha subunit